MGHKGSESIWYFNRQINKERYHLLPLLSPWKTNVPKFMSIPRCEYSVTHENTKTHSNITTTRNKVYWSFFTKKNT